MPLLLPLLLSLVGVFAVFPGASSGGVVTGVVLPVALGVWLTFALAGRPNAGAVAAGALAAFVGGAVWALFPYLGGAAVVGLGYAERALRVRGRVARIAHVSTAVVAGGIAGALASSYADAPLLYRGVATVMASVLACAPLLIPADDPRVRRLETAAQALGAPLSTALLDGAELLRCSDIGLLDRETRSRVAKSWRSLERLLEARLAMQTPPSRQVGRETAAAVTAMLDRRIMTTLESLTRAFAAATTVEAAGAGFDDSAARAAHERGDALEEQSRAMVEVGPL